MFEISASCSKTANISLCKYLLVGKTTMNIIKIDLAKNKTQNLIPVNVLNPKSAKKLPANNCHIKVNVIVLNKYICFICPANELIQFTKKSRKIRRKPRLTEPLVASLKQNAKSPIRFIRPSPTPISPSYKSRTHPKVLGMYNIYLIFLKHICDVL